MNVAPGSQRLFRPPHDHPRRGRLLLIGVVATLLLVPPLVGPAGADPNPTGPIQPTSWPYSSTPQFPTTPTGEPGGVVADVGPSGASPSGAGTAGGGTAASSPKSPTRGDGGAVSVDGERSTKGPCPSGVGTLTKPTSPVEVGDIFTPATDGFVGRTASAAGAVREVYAAGSGAPAGTGADPAAQFRYQSGRGEQLRVQAHFWDDYINGPQVAMVRVWLESLTASVSYDYPFYTLANGHGPQFKCYADDTDPGSNRFYFDEWVDVPSTMVEPGFNVRVEVLSLGGLQLHHADQNTLHVGPPPTSPGTAVTSALALALDDSALIDTNGAPDDVESLLRAQLAPAVRDFVHGLEGTSIPIRNAAGEQKGSFNISKFTLSDPSINLYLKATSTGSTAAPDTSYSDCFDGPFGLDLCFTIPIPGGQVPAGPPDDEYRLWIDASISQFDMHGNVSRSPFGADYHVPGSLDLTLSVALDVDPATGGLSISPDVRVENLDVHLDDELWIDIWQWVYDLLVNEDKIENLIVTVVEASNALVPAFANGNPALASAIDAAVRTQVTRLDGILGGGLALGGGGFGVLPLQFQTTCAPVGCDGFRAGDIGLWQQGLDLAVTTGATDKTGGSRYPKTYDPDTDDTSVDVHGRTTPSGGPFDVGLWADAALVNQVLTAVGASGVLDVSGSIGGAPVSIRGEVAPALVPTDSLGLASPGGAELTVLWPNTQVSVGDARFAVDVAVGVDATVDGTTGHLVPSAAVGINIRILRCPGLQLICGLLADPNLLDQFEQWLGSAVIQPLLSDSIGQIALPQVLGMRVADASLVDDGGNLAAFVDLAAVPELSLQVTANWGQGFHAPLESVTLEADPRWFPGSGDHVVHWSISNQDGTQVYESPAAGESDLDKTLPMSAFFPEVDGCSARAEVHAAVTVSRGGWTRNSDVHRSYHWFIDDPDCP